MAEQDLLNYETAKLVVAVGTRGAGKSFLILSIVYYLLVNDLMDLFFLNLPTFRIEQNNSYAWLNEYKDRVFIWNKAYTEELSEHVRSKAGQGKRIFYWVDDATSEAKELNLDKALQHIIFTGRHLGITLFLCFHALKKVIEKTIRINIDYLLLGKLTKQGVIDDAYQEFFSTMPEFRNKKKGEGERLFREFYYESMKTPHELICLDTKRQEYVLSSSFNVTQKFDSEIMSNTQKRKELDEKFPRRFPKYKDGKIIDEDEPKPKPTTTRRRPQPGTLKYNRLLIESMRPGYLMNNLDLFDPQSYT
jgi:hypothetical protein